MVISLKFILKIKLSSTNWLLEITATKTGVGSGVGGEPHEWQGQKSKATQEKKMETS